MVLLALILINNYKCQNISVRDIVQDISRRKDHMTSWNINFRMIVEVENKEIVSLLSRCFAMASVINNIPITPKRQVRIDRLNILRAIRGTTGIEGARLTEDEVKRIMETSRSNKVLPENRQQEEEEARNANILMKYIARLVKNKPGCVLDEQLIRTFHKILTKDIKYENNTPGEYRNYPVKVGNYSAPKHGEIEGLIGGFIAWFNQGEPKGWDPIIRAIVAHFYIVSIHPFGDGNGRTARAVESFLLYKARINELGFYSLANFYYQHRSEYISKLDFVRFETDNELTPFVLFALRGFESELESVHHEILLEVKEIAFRDYVREVMNQTGSKPRGRMQEFMMMLGSESASIKAIRSGKHELSKLYNDLTDKTLSRDLEELTKNQLILIQNDQVKANIDIMNKFTAHYGSGEQPRPEVV